MTMPSKIWASEDVSGASDEWKMAMWHGHQNLIKPVRTQYIRADLVYDLVSAAERALNAQWCNHGDLDDALSRFRAITP